MPLEIVALIEKPHLLIAILALGGFFTLFAERLGARRRPNIRATRGRWNAKADNDLSGWRAKFYLVKPKPIDAADQLRIVMQADFTIKPLLNRNEVRVFKELV